MYMQCMLSIYDMLSIIDVTLGKLVTEKPVDFVGFDNVVEFNKNWQNDDNVVKAYKDLFSWNSLKNKPVNWLKVKCLYYML